MTTIDLDIPFKGSRTYLQSANGWDAVAQAVTGGLTELDDRFRDRATTLDITFRTLIGEGVHLRICDPKERSREALAQCIFKSPDGGKAYGELIPSGKPVSSHIEDVENGMKPAVVISDDGAVYEGDIPMSLSQVYVALIKFWHQARVDNDCKWLATRLQLPMACLDAAPPRAEIRPETILKDGQGSVSAVFAGDGTDGRIWFYKT